MLFTLRTHWEGELLRSREVDASEVDTDKEFRDEVDYVLSEIRHVKDVTVDLSTPSGDVTRSHTFTDNWRHCDRCGNSGTVVTFLTDHTCID